MAMKLERILLGQPSGGNMVSAAGPSRVKRLKVDVTVSYTGDAPCPGRRTELAGVSGATC